MSDEVVKPGNEEALSPNQSLSEAIKDKIFNKIYFYILVSFLLVNWQEILILFKSSEDIFYTLFFNIALFIDRLIREAISIHHISSVLIVGGVISNNIIKNYLSNSFYGAKIYFPEKNLSSDNAVGIAYLSKYKLGWED